MAEHSDWVADVRRWVQNQPSRSVAAIDAQRDALAELGYEAADPSLQDSRWMAPAPTSFADLR